MFGVDSSELLIIVLVAVVVIGPRDLPRVMRTVGNWIGRARAMANQFRSGVDQMVRDSEIADLEQKWREQNEAIMRAYPKAPPESDWGLPTPAPLPPPELTPVSLGKEQAPPPQLAKAADETPAVPAAPPARRPPVHVPPLLKPSQPEPRAAAPEPDLP
jgi:sec-independent protein translocase protein TatB